MGWNAGRALYEVGDSNVVIASSDWQSDLPSPSFWPLGGAVTWIDGATGLDGVVTVENSLTGLSTFRLTLLANGNYVVTSKTNLLATSFVWGDGNAGATETLFGEAAFQRTAFSSEILSLSNGHYMIRSDDGSSTGGTLIWADGSLGAHRSHTSLFGGFAHAGESGIYELPDGDVLALTARFGGSRGAITRIPGDTGLSGRIDMSNSIFGAHFESNVAGSLDPDAIGSGGAFVLANGSVAIWSPDARSVDSNPNGAITILEPGEPTMGSFHDRDHIWGAATSSRSSASLVALTNGDLVYVDPTWDALGADDVGLVQHFSGAAPFDGVVGNGLTGSTDADRVGSGGVVPLVNGEYVVLSPSWDLPGGTPDVGAATWGEQGGTVGVVTTSNSLHGDERSGSLVGSGGAVALADGSVAILSPTWSSSSTDLAVGAVTWVPRQDRFTGPVHLGNSVYGRVLGDLVSGDGLVEMTDGALAVSSGAWNGNGASGAGAVTRVLATAPAGPVTEFNSIHGASVDDGVGRGSVQALSNGRFLVWAPDFDGVGAVTLGTQVAPNGVVSSANSAVGSLPGGLLEPLAVWTSGKAIVIPTNENRVVLLRDVSDLPTPPPTTAAPTTTNPTTATTTTTTTSTSTTTTTTTPDSEPAAPVTTLPGFGIDVATGDFQLAERPGPQLMTQPLPTTTTTTTTTLPAPVPIAPIATTTTTAPPRPTTTTTTTPRPTTTTTTTQPRVDPAPGAIRRTPRRASGTRQI